MLPLFVYRFLGIFILSLIFQGLFWNEEVSLNLLIFSSLLSILSIILEIESWKNKTIIVVAIGTFTALISIVLHYSTISFIAFYISALIGIGLLLESRTKLLFFAFLSGISKPFFIISVELEKFLLPETNIKKEEKVSSGHYFFKRIKLFLLPLVIFSVFFILFKWGNHVFNKITDDIGYYFLTIFNYISFQKIPCMLLGAGISCIILLRIKNDYWLKREGEQEEKLYRERKKTNMIQYTTLSLKNEYWIGIITLIMVNSLCIFINTIDIFWLWINFDAKNIQDFAKMVHDGTYILIFTILLSMGVLIYFFRGNLNFIPKNKLLLQLAYLWLLQNVFMALSVGLRTWYYIHERGLAYKRIGVLIFLVLTLFGIFSLYIKIKQQKTFYFLWNVNIKSVYLMLIFMSWIDWESWIVSHNINYTKNYQDFDMEFLITRSDKTLSILQENWNKIPKNIQTKYFYYQETGYNIATNYEEYLKARVKKFKEKKQKQTWRSWNYAEYQAYELLK